MKNLQSRVEERSPNWLPIPGVVGHERREAQVDENDFFRKAEIIAFYPKQRHGMLQNEGGERISFDLRNLCVVGDASYLDVGIRVGYDVSRTSNGNRITCLKVY